MGHDRFGTNPTVVDIEWYSDGYLDVEHLSYRPLSSLPSSIRSSLGSSVGHICGLVRIFLLAVRIYELLLCLLNDKTSGTKVYESMMNAGPKFVNPFAWISAKYTGG